MCAAYDGLKPSGEVFCGGLVADYRSRSRFALVDYTTALKYPGKATSACIFIAIATLFSTISLAGVIEANTMCDPGRKRQPRHQIAFTGIRCRAGADETRADGVARVR